MLLQRILNFVHFLLIFLQYFCIIAVFQNLAFNDCVINIRHKTLLKTNVGNKGNRESSVLEAPGHKAVSTWGGVGAWSLTSL